VSFDVEADADLDCATGNRSKMFEVVDNLLNNAVRFSPPGQVVEITLAREGPGRQCLTVRDHGPGISETVPERVFEAYHQGQPSPYSSQNGFGLGLHVVKTNLELMGGSVSVRNHSTGGALFVCSLADWSLKE
jgi:signal transduction histidine kinase